MELKQFGKVDLFLSKNFRTYCIQKKNLLILISIFFSRISDLGTTQIHKTNNGDILTLALKPENQVEKRLSPDGTRKLQDEINTLTKRNCELESQLRNLESTHTKDGDALDGSSGDGSKLKELERLVKILKQEKEEAQKDKQDMQEKLKLQDKELKDALAQRKLAMTEYTEVSDKLSELRQQKQKLSRQVSFSVFI